MNENPAVAAAAELPVGRRERHYSDFPTAELEAVGSPHPYPHLPTHHTPEDPAAAAVVAQTDKRLNLARAFVRELLVSPAKQSWRRTRISK